MSALMGDPWSDNPNAPQITYGLHVIEGVDFAGGIIGTILYGIIVVLFFQCIGTFLNRANRARNGTKWLIAHTVAMFSFASINAMMSLDRQSATYVDNRNFPGIDGELPPGPLGYEVLGGSDPFIIIPNLTTMLNQWLADGLLLYRCHIICGTSYWVIAFPCFLYLASVGLGIVSIYGNSVPGFPLSDIFALSCFTISVALNVFLTLMIVVKLVVHSRNFRKAVGASVMRAGELYDVIVTIIVESFALYAVTYLVFIGSWRTRSLSYIVAPILFGAQVIAPFLIVLRVANRSALKSEAGPSRNFGSIHFRSLGESTNGNTTLSGENFTSSTETNGGTPVEFGDEVGDTAEEVPSTTEPGGRPTKA